MKEWLVANGGPPAIIVLGLGIISLNLKIGLAVCVLGVIYWIYKSSRFPYVFARKTSINLQGLSDKEVIERTRALIRNIGALMAQHVRYQPSRHEEQDLSLDPHSAWARGVNRSNSHDQNTAARFFDEYYGDCIEVVSSLYARGALSSEEIRQINWWIGTISYGGGLAHQLADLSPLLASAADRLESGHLSQPKSSLREES